MRKRHLERSGRTDRLTDEDSLLDLRVVEDSQDVAWKLASVELVHARVRRAEAAQVEGDDREILAKVRRLLPPGGVMAAGSMDEGDGRAFSVDLVVDLRAVRIRCEW